MYSEECNEIEFNNAVRILVLLVNTRVENKSMQQYVGVKFNATVGILVLLANTRIK